MTMNSINLTTIGYGLLALVAGSAFTWCGWVTIAISDRPSETSVYRIVETAAPYIRDKKAIESRLERIATFERQLGEVIRQNTAAINSLRVELTRLSASR